ncbi:hypothetical protein [Domibacillus indicus]|nr:hypothetical protein [Domibacillus indicus]
MAKMIAAFFNWYINKGIKMKINAENGAAKSNEENNGRVQR